MPFDYNFYFRGSKSPVMISFPNAKINIGLAVTERRDDGYHNLETVFYPVQWCDVLEIIEQKGHATQKVMLSLSGLAVPGPDADNLCVKAYYLLDEAYNLPPVSMFLHKVIPSGAGLGGGSSDGAHALKMLNALFHLNLNGQQLEAYALKLGSDCPFFIRNHPVFATGRGEKFQETALSLEGYHIAVVKPPCTVSTREAFAGISARKPLYSPLSAAGLPVESWKGKIVNDFEQTVFRSFPEIEVIRETLYGLGAVYASMSGSGSSVYGLFREKPRLEGHFDGCRVFIA
jgi:4-diphosphocytidyl-2-C-methyl-D-erythritol kinase